MNFSVSMSICVMCRGLRPRRVAGAFVLYGVYYRNSLSIVVLSYRRFNPPMCALSSPISSNSLAPSPMPVHWLRRYELTFATAQYAVIRFTRSLASLLFLLTGAWLHCRDHLLLMRLIVCLLHSPLICRRHDAAMPWCAAHSTTWDCVSAKLLSSAFPTSTGKPVRSL